eukprot:11166175-Lingulodinium_polyedra.AAC.1
MADFVRSGDAALQVFPQIQRAQSLSAQSLCAPKVVELPPLPWEWGDKPWIVSAAVGGRRGQQWDT